MQRRNNVELFYVITGVFFEKILPLLISFVFIQKMSETQYALWVLFFQISTMSTSSIDSPLNLFYNKTFYKIKDKKSIPVIELRLILPIFILTFLVSLFYSNSFLVSGLVLLMVITSITAMLIFNSLRYRAKNRSYAIRSFIRFIVFLFLLGALSSFRELKLNDILVSYSISNFIAIVDCLNFLLVRWKTITFFSEFLQLSLYGLLTSLLSGIEKIAMGTFQSNLLDLAIVGYAIALANSPSLLTESFKKYLSPYFFKDFNQLGFYSKDSIKKAIQALTLLTAAQLIIPILFYFILEKFSLLKESLIIENFLALVLGFSIIMSLYNAYHFINPYLFYKNKSNKLSMILCLSTALFLLILFLPIPSANIFVTLILAKAVSVFSLVLLTYKLTLSGFRKSVH